VIVFVGEGLSCVVAGSGLGFLGVLEWWWCELVRGVFA
jgi:hypothetical protein